MSSTAQVGTLERVHLLKALPAFRDLAPGDLSILAQQARERIFSAGAVVLGADRRAALRLIVEGEVRMFRGSVDLGTRGPGDGFGLLELLAQTAQGVRAVAETELLALSIDEEAFLDVLEDNFTILYQLLSGVCRLRIEQLTTGSPDSTPSLARWVRATGADLDLADRLLFLRRLFPFAQGHVAALVDIARHLKEHRARPGETLWSAGDKASGTFLLIVAGEISASLPSGQTLPFGPMTMPGSLEAIAATPRWFEAVASTELHALRMDGELLLDVFDDNEDIAIGYLNMLAREALRARPSATFS